GRVSSRGMPCINQKPILPLPSKSGTLIASNRPSQQPSSKPCNGPFSGISGTGEPQRECGQAFAQCATELDFMFRQRTLVRTGDVRRTIGRAAALGLMQRAFAEGQAAEH